MKPEPHKNNILRAYRLGIEHGQQNAYNPPLWVIARHGLWLPAYNNGFNIGHLSRIAIAGVK